MDFTYDTIGPHPVDHDGRKVVSTSLLKFWKARELDYPGISKAIGVYVIALRSGKSQKLTPWYVGKTDLQGFRKRFGQQDPRFRDVLESAEAGDTLEIFLIPRMTKGGNKFMKVKQSAMPSNDELETMLIASALDKNHELVNARKVRHKTSMLVPGFLNDEGDPTEAATAMRNMLKR